MTILREYTTLNPVKEDGTRRVRLISPGQGSSGLYSEEVISQYVHEALPQGSLIYLDHTDTEDEDRRGGTRSIRDVAGKIVSNPVYEANAPEGAGSYARVKFTKATEALLEDIHDAVGVSVEIHNGRKDSENNIIEMGAHPLNALAVVPVPGRDGRIFEEFTQSFRASALEKPNEEGEQDMAISKEDIAAIVAGVQEALKPEPKDEVEVDVAETIRKVMKAELPEPLEEAAIAEALESGDAEAAIAKQAKIVEAVKAVEKVEKTDDIDKGVRLSESAEDNDPAPKDDYERGQIYLERFKKAGK